MGVGAPAWETRYGRKLVVTDIAIVVGAVYGAQVLRFGASPDDLSQAISSGSVDISYSVVSTLLATGWLVMLALGETRKPQNFGAGSSEYRRVVSATLMTFGLFAVLAFASRIDIGRGYLLIALPTGLAALLAGRFLWRRRLHSRRRQGKNVYRTMLVGEAAKVSHFYKQMRADINAGFKVVVAATNDQERVSKIIGGAVTKSYADLLSAVEEFDVDTVIITGADDLSPDRLQMIGWELDDRKVDLVVAAALTDVAGPRIHMRQAVGFPLIYVDYPKLTGSKRLIKRLFDLTASASLIVLLSPVMLAVAAAVKLTSPGPIFYSQERVGMRGRPFPMYKFRSMVEDADDQLASLLDAQGTSDRPLHKIQNDPRITPVGRFIRRYSLDELPQLANVLFGTMSLVGPRPQRQGEVALYDKHHHRRLLVKPGITGLWQVSGRSSLDWDDAIRLDLYYVENWSLVGDLVILWRTIRAVAIADGAV